MLIKPNLKDEEIIACLQNAYGLTIEKVVFLPLGADFKTAVYRVTKNNGSDYFLKLRSGEFLEASVSVPKYLVDLGYQASDPTSGYQNRATLDKLSIIQSNSIPLY